MKQSSREVEAVQPFAPPQDEFVRVHNSIFDMVMPALSPNAFKILMLVVRETFGRFEKAKGIYRVSTQGIKYSIIRERCGIASDSTISDALHILTTTKCLKAVRKTRWEEKSYRVNPDFKVKSVQQFFNLVNDISAKRKDEKLKRQRKRSTFQDEGLTLIDEVA
jgi:hypothetical protein